MQLFGHVGISVHRKRETCAAELGQLPLLACGSTGTAFMKMALESRAVGTLDCASKCGISIYILRVSTIWALFHWGSRCQEKPIVNFWFKDFAVLGSCTFCFNIFLAPHILSPIGLPCKYIQMLWKAEPRHLFSYVPYRQWWCICPANSSGFLIRLLRVRK